MKNENSEFIKELHKAYARGSGSTHHTTYFNTIIRQADPFTAMKVASEMFDKKDFGSFLSSVDRIDQNEAYRRLGERIYATEDISAIRVFNFLFAEKDISVRARIISTGDLDEDENKEAYEIIDTPLIRAVAQARAYLLSYNVDNAFKDIDSEEKRAFLAYNQDGLVVMKYAITELLPDEVFKSKKEAERTKSRLLNIRSSDDLTTEILWMFKSVDNGKPILDTEGTRAVIEESTRKGLIGKSGLHYFNSIIAEIENEAVLNGSNKNSKNPTQ